MKVLKAFTDDILFSEKFIVLDQQGQDAIAYLNNLLWDAEIPISFEIEEA